jgi:hypothetical protein
MRALFSSAFQAWKFFCEKTPVASVAFFSSFAFAPLRAIIFCQSPEGGITGEEGGHCGWSFFQRILARKKGQCPWGTLSFPAPWEASMRGLSA